MCLKRWRLDLAPPPIVTRRAIQLTLPTNVENVSREMTAKCDDHAQWSDVLHEAVTLDERVTQSRVTYLTLSHVRNFQSRDGIANGVMTFRQIDSSRRDSSCQTDKICVTRCDIQRDAGLLTEVQAEAGRGLPLPEVPSTDSVLGFVISNVAFVPAHHTHCNRSVTLKSKPCWDMIA